MSRPMSPSTGLTAVRTVGAILPADLLAAVVTGTDLDGLRPDDYHLELGLTPREAANRAWSVLTGAWAGYRLALDARPPGDPAVGLTREKWLGVVLRELGFGRVPVAPAGGLVADERSWPVSHCVRGIEDRPGPAGSDLPVHLLGWRSDLDHRTPGLAGAAARAPHAMVQELLNRSPAYLWALLANGNSLRLLRDSSTLVGPAYVEFDLEAIFDGDVFSDFAALFLLCHQSRFEATDPDVGMASCWLERWRTHAAEVGTRALGALKTGVRQAIEALGTGLLSHPTNGVLRADLDAGRLDPADFSRALLRIVYRLLFCFVAEDRDVLLDPEGDDTAKKRYQAWFATGRLRAIAARRQGDNHDDLWQALSLVLDSLGTEDGCPKLALPGLGGIFELGPADVAVGSSVTNRHLLTAIRHLCVITPPGGGPRRMVDYRHLGAEELGGVYESLLEYLPRPDPATRSFTLQSLAGNERKKTGAYYTPTSLTESLLDTALEPLLDTAVRQPDPEASLLDLTVCDPACGSGHFLVAAARRIASRLATTRAEGGEPSLDDLHQAMHDVVAHCLYGVDVNPMAVELAEVSLWLEGMRAGAPLSLLHGHLKVGNSLLGATPALLAAGIPDDAFAPIEGDDRKTAGALKKRNKREQAGHHSLFTDTGISVATGSLAAQVAAIETLPTANLADIHVAARRLAELDASPARRQARLVADAWCAAFVLPKAPGQPELTQADLLRLDRTPADRRSEADHDMVQTVDSAQQRYRFFHWHLEFPQIFTPTTAATADPVTGWTGGFDCVIGNPPWEHVELKEQEWFAARFPSIADASGAARKRLIADLREERPTLHSEYTAALRLVNGERSFLGNSGRYPLAGRGRINTYAVFAEADRSLLAPTGRLGVILPTGIATDATTQYFFKDLVIARSLVSLYDFENALPIFEGVHRSFKFCLLTLSGASVPVDAASFAFFAHHPDDLARPGVRFALTPEEITLLNPNTGTCPVFRTRRDAEITLDIYRRHPVLIRKGDPDGNPWGVSFMQGLFNMTSDSDLFNTRADLETDGWTLEGNTFHRGDEVMLPLYEAKMVHHFDHRWATYTEKGDVRDVTEAEHADPNFTVLPRYWVAKPEVDTRLADRWDHDWLLGFRRIARSTDERTMLADVVPVNAIGDNIFLALAEQVPICLGPSLSSFALDFVLRQKLGGTNLNFFYIEQLPVPAPAVFKEPCAWEPGRSLQDWVEDRLGELIYTAYDMAPAAWALGDDGSPFAWDPERRAVLRAELDAGFFHLYGIDRDDVDYILGTFPIVNRKDVNRHGEERTRRLVPESFDAMAKAIDQGTAFESSLSPPAGEGQRHPEMGR